MLVCARGDLSEVHGFPPRGPQMSPWRVVPSQRSAHHRHHRRGDRHRPLLRDRRAPRRAARSGSGRARSCSCLGCSAGDVPANLASVKSDVTGRYGWLQHRNAVADRQPGYIRATSGRRHRSRVDQELRVAADEGRPHAGRLPRAGRGRRGHRAAIRRARAEGGRVPGLGSLKRRGGARSFRQGHVRGARHGRDDARG